jgi:hypothetical protein
MRTTKLRALAAALPLGLALAAAPACAITLGKIDTFSAGADGGWHDGGSPNPPSVVSNGGPAGSGDGWLQLTALGGSGPGSRLSVIAGADWSGNWTSAGVTTIGLDAINLGATDLNLRLYFDSGAGSALSTVALVLPAHTAWTHLVFSVLPAALTGLNPTATLQAVTAFRIFDNPTAAFPPPAIVASLGIDNVSALAAVPEPATYWLWAAGVGVLALPAVRRRLAARA